jgi:hypothetical protein
MGNQEQILQIALNLFRSPGYESGRTRYDKCRCVSHYAVRAFRLTQIPGENIRRESTQISGHFGCPVGR